MSERVPLTAIPPILQLWRAFLFVLAVVGGGILGSLISYISDLPSSANMNSVVLLGIAATYAGFGLVPATLIGLPAVWFLERRGFSRTPATFVLAVGGGATGALIMLATFGFLRLGVIAGGSIGLVLGLLLFPKLRGVAES